MNISYASREMRDLCDNHYEMKRYLGAELAELAMMALADIRAAPTVVALPNIWELVFFNNDYSRLSIRHRDLEVVEFSPVGACGPIVGIGDWENVRILKLLSVGGRDEKKCL